MQAAAGHLADGLGQEDVLLIFEPEGGERRLWSLSLLAPLGHLGPPSLQASGRGHTPTEDVTSASSAPRSRPLPPAVLTPRSRLSRRADSRVLPRTAGTQLREASTRTTGVLDTEFRTQLQAELENPGPEPRFRLARAAVASGTGSPASGYWTRASRYPKAAAVRLGWGGLFLQLLLVCPLGSVQNVGPSVH